MAICWPTAALDCVTDISLSMLKRMEVLGLILDVDNTLASHGSQTPFPGALAWARHLTQKGIQIVIVSNNFDKRVAPFAAQFDLPFISFAMKPLPFGYFRAIRLMGLSRSQVAAVGDQIFTDILGANLSGVKSILVVPREEEQTFSFQLRRKWEIPIRESFEKSGLGKKYVQEKQKED